jgi:predicted aspartyl protease
MVITCARSPKDPSPIFKEALLFVFLNFLSGIVITTAHAQSRNVDGSFLVNARVNGVPAVLMLDTGAEYSVLDRQFAQRLGLRSIAIADLRKLYSSESTEIMLVSTLETQTMHGSDVKVITDDLTATSRALGEHIDGVLGDDLLQTSTITLDYGAGSMSVDPAAGVHHGVLIKLRKLDDRYFVLLELDRVPMALLLDTGTNFSMLSQSGLQKLNHDRTEDPIINGVRSPGTSATSQLVCIHQLVIGGISYQHFPMRVQPTTSAGLFADPGIDGLLGSDFLGQFVVELDLANRTMYLNHDHNVEGDQDRLSTIGIQFAKDPTGVFTVMAVWSPTPASEANLKMGDQILSVNGLDTSEMTQQDLSRQLHGEPGREIQLRIRSEEEDRTVRLTTRNLLCRSALTRAR